MQPSPLLIYKDPVSPESKPHNLCPHAPCPPPPAPRARFVCTDLPVPDCPCTRNHATFVLLRLASFHGSSTCSRCWGGFHACGARVCSSGHRLVDIRGASAVGPRPVPWIRSHTSVGLNARFLSLGRVPRRGTAGACGDRIPRFPRKPYAVFHSRGARGSDFSTSSPSFVVFCFLRRATPWAVWVSVSLVASDIRLALCSSVSVGWTGPHGFCGVSWDAHLWVLSRCGSTGAPGPRCHAFLPRRGGACTRTQRRSPGHGGSRPCCCGSGRGPRETPTQTVPRSDLQSRERRYSNCHALSSGRLVSRQSDQNRALEALRLPPKGKTPT